MNKKVFDKNKKKKIGFSHSEFFTIFLPVGVSVYPQIFKPLN